MEPCEWVCLGFGLLAGVGWVGWVYCDRRWQERYDALADASAAERGRGVSHTTDNGGRR